MTITANADNNPEKKKTIEFLVQDKKMKEGT